MFSIPDRTAAFNGRNDGEVIAGWWRASGPFECPRVPWVGSGLFAFEVRGDQVPNEDERGDGLKDGPARDDLIQESPAAVGLVGVDTAGHAEQAGDVHEIEGEMETDDEKPEVPAAQSFREHAAGHLRIPVIEGREDHEENRPDQHVMKMRDDKVGTAELPVEGRYREHDAGEAGDEELEEKPDGEFHRRGEVDVAAPQGREPVEDFDSGGDRDRHG